jgi:hypothetical protein
VGVKGNERVLQGGCCDCRAGSSIGGVKLGSELHKKAQLRRNSAIEGMSVMRPQQRWRQSLQTTIAGEKGASHTTGTRSHLLQIVGDCATSTRRACV